MTEIKGTAKVILLALVLLVFLGQQGFGQDCIAPPEGMIGWWPGDGDAQDIWNGNNGLLQGGATFAAGVVEQAFSLDGEDDHVSVPDNDVWTLGDDAFTIDLWVNFDTVPDRASFVSHDEGGGETNKWIFWYDAYGHRAPGGPALRLHTNSPSIGALDPVVFPWMPNPWQWYHVAVTRSGSSYTLYIDGVPVITEIDAHTIPDVDAPLSFGQAEDAFFFDGLIDEVEIFDRALTSDEISAIYLAGAAGKCKVQEIAIDVKPGRYPNCFDNNGIGVIPVAILGSSEFDVTQIDIASLSFHGLQLRTKRDGSAPCKVADLSGDFSSGPAGAPDGFDDLVCPFANKKVPWEAGSVWAEISGQLMDGTLFAGIDSICVTQ